MFAKPTLALPKGTSTESSTNYKRETLPLPRQRPEREQVNFPKVPRKKKKTITKPVSSLPTVTRKEKRVSRETFSKIARNLPKLPILKEEQGLTLSMPVNYGGNMLPKVSSLERSLE